VRYSGAGISGPGAEGATVSGEISLTCRDGQPSVQGQPSCRYFNARPTVHNDGITPADGANYPQRDLYLSGDGSSAQRYCSAVFNGTLAQDAGFEKVNQTLENRWKWTAWGGTGNRSYIPMNGDRCTSYGCACWAYTRDSQQDCYTLKNLSCTIYGKAAFSN